MNLATLSFILFFALLVIIAVIVFVRFVHKELVPNPITSAPQLGTRRLLSESEAAFYWILKKANADKYIIAPKVPLVDFFKAPLLEKSLYTMLQHGHIDFLLLHPRSWEPIGGIEVDDSTHRTPAGKDRSNRKDILFKSAGLPLARFRVGDNWSVDSLQAWISSLSNDDTANLRTVN